MHNICKQMNKPQQPATKHAYIYFFCRVSQYKVVRSNVRAFAISFLLLFYVYFSLVIVVVVDGFSIEMPAIAEPANSYTHIHFVVRFHCQSKIEKENQLHHCLYRQAILIYVVVVVFFIFFFYFECDNFKCAQNANNLH